MTRLFVSFQREKQMPKKEARIIKHKLDSNRKPRLSAGQQAMLNNLAAQPDEAIDYSDAEASPANAQWYKHRVLYIDRLNKALLCV